MKILMSACLRLATAEETGVKPTSSFILSVSHEDVKHETTHLDHTAPTWPEAVVDLSNKTSAVSIPLRLVNRGKIVFPSKLARVTSLPVTFTFWLYHPVVPVLSSSYTSGPLPGRIERSYTPGVTLNCIYPKFAITSVSDTSMPFLVSCN